MIEMTQSDAFFVLNDVTHTYQSGEEEEHEALCGIVRGSSWQYLGQMDPESRRLRVI